MKLPKVVLPDGDGDGVTDQFDLEPNTPKGCPVDSHGVSKDTDGDGVPDSVIKKC
jgi:OOP family OmpA-OmpF porin